jgi:esterase/lipase
LERIYAALGTADKEKLYLSGSGHVITRDAAREQVFHAVLEFVRRVEAQG